MQTKMPQEIEVWHVLPAIRRELTKVLVNKYHLSQKDAASEMGIAESAVSQYLTLKRAKEVVFDERVLELIKRSADNIVNHKSCVIKELQTVCDYFRKTGYLCKIHKQTNPALLGNCEVCIK